MKSTYLIYVVVIQVVTLIRSSNTCGGNVDGSAGFITSPNYPNSYLHNSNCTWKVTGTAGSTFSLQFEKFDISCNDTVTIYDGNPVTSTTTLLNATCGINKAGAMRTLKSTSNVIAVQLITDDTVRSTGFKLTWNMILAITTSETTLENKTDAIPTTTSLHQTTPSSTEGSGDSSETSDTNTIDSMSTSQSATTTATTTTTITITTTAMTTDFTTSSKEVSQSNKAAGLSVPVIAGAAGGGAAFLIVIIIVIVCCVRRNRSKPTEQKVSMLGLEDDTNVNMGGQNLSLKELEEGSKNMSTFPSYTVITEESITKMKNTKAIVDGDKHGGMNDENSEINPYDTTSKFDGLDSNGTSAPGIVTTHSDVKFETDMYEQVPSLDIHAVQNKEHQVKSDVENANDQNKKSNTESPNLENKTQMMDIYAVPHKNKEDIYQETLEGEYDVLHQKRQKTTSGDNIYDVSQPHEGDYSDARLVKELKDDDTYDHTNIQDGHDVTYDTADNVLSE